MAKVAAILVTANPNHTAPDDAAMTKIDGRESALRAIELMTNRDPITQVLLAVDPADAEEIKRRIGSHPDKCHPASALRRRHERRR